LNQPVVLCFPQQVFTLFSTSQKIRVYRKHDGPPSDDGAYRFPSWNLAFLSAPQQRGQRLAQPPDALSDALLVLIGEVQTERILPTPIGVERFSHNEGHPTLCCLSQQVL
jgi:hypothetical protein